MSLDRTILDHLRSGRPIYTWISETADGFSHFCPAAACPFVGVSGLELVTRLLGLGERLLRVEVLVRTGDPALIRVRWLPVPGGEGGMSPVSGPGRHTSS